MTTKIDKIAALGKRHGFSLDELEANYMQLSTRDNGSVYHGVASQIDVDSAKELRDSITKDFTGVKVNIDVVDEWVIVEVTQ